MAKIELTDEQEAVLSAWYLAQQKVLAANAALKDFVLKHPEIYEASTEAIRQEGFASRAVRELFFPKPSEGTSSLALPAGYKLKCELKYTRKIDKEALESVRDPLKEKGVSLDSLIRNKPELELKVYRQLTEEQKKVFDVVLTTTPGNPSIELVAPKAKE